MMSGKIGDSGEPYEQRWVMRSARGLPLVGAAGGDWALRIIPGRTLITRLGTVPGLS
jgi:hypothetical protein